MQFDPPKPEGQLVQLVPEPKLLQDCARADETRRRQRRVARISASTRGRGRREVEGERDAGKRRLLLSKRVQKLLQGLGRTGKSTAGSRERQGRANGSKSDSFDLLKAVSLSASYHTLSSAQTVQQNCSTRLQLPVMLALRLSFILAFAVLARSQSQSNATSPNSTSSAAVTASTAAVPSCALSCVRK